MKGEGALSTTGMDTASRHRYLRVWLLVLLCSWPGFMTLALAEDQQNAESLLSAMTHAMQDTNYHGTFVYIRPGTIETMRIVHSKRPEGVYERLVALNGTRREVVRTPHRTACYFPDKRRVVVNNMAPMNALISGLPRDIQSLKDFYRFELGKPERIADLEAHRVSMLPKDEHRYGRLFWIEKKTYLPLKYELIDQQGQMIERMLFTTLVIADPDSADLQATTDAAGFKWIEQGSKAEGQPLLENRWRVADLPAGFRLLSHEQRHFSSEDAVEHMVYSDGVASVSIFIADLEEGRSVQEQDVHLGAVHVFKSVHNGKQITVMGEVPQETVKLIGHNLQLSDPQ